MEPELFPWCLIEYRHMAEAVGADNLTITNVNKDELSKIDFCKATADSAANLSLKNICILDPEAPLTLQPDDKDRFNHLVFGGILGNDPPEARTRELQISNAARRNLGKAQLPTDNAVMVAKKIIDGTPLEQLEFTQDLIIPIESDDAAQSGEEIILPFKYVMVNGKPFISDKLIDHIKEHGF